MSDCIDTRFEQMLYAYEIGMLSDEETTEMELHLCECDSCFQNASEFQNFADLIRKSSKIRERIHKDANSKQSSHITRTLLIAAIVIAVAIPVYYVSIDFDQVQVAQELLLLPDRGSSDAIVSLAGSDIVEVSFVIEGAAQGDVYQILVRSIAQDTIYINEEFSGFKANGVGSIQLALSDLRAGRHTLDVLELIDELPALVTQYTFEVK